MQTPVGIRRGYWGVHLTGRQSFPNLTSSDFWLGDMKGKHSQIRPCSHAARVMVIDGRKCAQFC